MQLLTRRTLWVLVVLHALVLASVMPQTTTTTPTPTTTTATPTTTTATPTTTTATPTTTTANPSTAASSTGTSGSSDATTPTTTTPTPTTTTTPTPTTTTATPNSDASEAAATVATTTAPETTTPTPTTTTATPTTTISSSASGTGTAALDGSTVNSEYGTKSPSSSETDTESEAESTTSSVGSWLVPVVIGSVVVGVMLVISCYVRSKKPNDDDDDQLERGTDMFFQHPRTNRTNTNASNGPGVVDQAALTNKDAIPVLQKAPGGHQYSYQQTNNTNNNLRVPSATNNAAFARANSMNNQPHQVTQVAQPPAPAASKYISTKPTAAPAPAPSAPAPAKVTSPTNGSTPMSFQPSFTPGTSISGVEL